MKIRNLPNLQIYLFMPCQCKRQIENRILVDKRISTVTFGGILIIIKNASPNIIKGSFDCKFFSIFSSFLQYIQQWWMHQNWHSSLYSFPILISIHPSKLMLVYDVDAIWIEYFSGSVAFPFNLRGISIEESPFQNISVSMTLTIHDSQNMQYQDQLSATKQSHPVGPKIQPLMH